MSSHVIRQIREYMEANGFKLIRTGKHYIWSNGTHNIVTSRSPSDGRAFRNVQGEVKKRLKQVGG